MASSISTVDLFCGAGGLTHGFEQAGLPVKAGYDIDSICRFPYERNTKAEFVLKDVEDVSISDLAKHFSNSDIKVLAGCAPCQPFSNYSRRYLDKGSKWRLVQDFARLLEECNPEIVSMENVLQLKHHSVFQEFIRKLEQLWSFQISLRQENRSDKLRPDPDSRVNSCLTAWI